MAENKSIRILVAEDEDSNFTYLERVLRREYGTGNIVRARTGVEAIELLKSDGNFSIILLDIKMPVMSGLEAIKLLKEINSSIPVIAITAYAMAGDKELVIESGFDDYLAKPFEPNAVISTINNNLEKFGLLH